MKRSNFLRDFVKLGEGTECPDIFMLWSGLSAVSCTLGRRLFIEFSTGPIFPNTYVVLVAGAGKCRKSTSIKFAERLLRDLTPQQNLVSQRISAEGLIDALRIAQVSDEKLLVRDICEGFVVVDEFKTFLNKKTLDGGLGTLLIPFWDAVDSFEYRTKGRGIENIRNSCLGILGGSTIQGIKEAITPEAVGDGMCSRFIFVYEDEAMPPIPFPEFTEEKRMLMASLVSQLQEMLSFSGSVVLAPEARKYYEEWYIDFRLNSPMHDNIFLEGYASRRHTHMLKLAMCFAAADFSPNFIRGEHVEKANTILGKSEVDLPKIMGLIASTEEGAFMEVVYDMIAKKGPLGESRSKILRSLGNKIDSRKLMEIIETLVHSRRIEHIALGGDIRYKKC